MSLSTVGSQPHVLSYRPPLSSCCLSGSATLDGPTAVKFNIQDFRDFDPCSLVRRLAAEVSKNLNVFIFRDEQFKDMWVY